MTWDRHLAKHALQDINAQTRPLRSASPKMAAPRSIAMELRRLPSHVLPAPIMKSMDRSLQAIASFVLLGTSARSQRMLLRSTHAQLVITVLPDLQLQSNVL